MDQDLLLSTGGSVVISSVLLQWLKNSQWFPFLGIEQKFQAANRIMALIFAGVASLGIHLSFDTHTGTATMTGLTAVNLSHGLWQWFVQFALQHGFYKTAVVPVELMVKNTAIQTDVLNYLKTLHQGEK